MDWQAFFPLLLASGVEWVEGVTAVLCVGLTIGWVEGLELNLFGGVLGLDIRRPALKFPGVGRLGLPLGR